MFTIRVFLSSFLVNCVTCLFQSIVNWLFHAKAPVCHWNRWIFVSGLAVCSITGMRSITLSIIWLTSLSGTVTHKPWHYKSKGGEENIKTCNNHLWCFCFPSPQLRMSFIVFSTEGRILMPLTEDRWHIY